VMWSKKFEATEPPEMQNRHSDQQRV